MKRTAYCLFETGLGACAIAWRVGEPHAVAFFLLPEATEQLTAARIAGMSQGGSASPPPPGIAAVIGMVQGHLRGEARDFRDVAVDLDGAGPFSVLVYREVRSIPAGRTTTYGEIARALGRPAAARAVGQALGRNPVPLIIPCHRVLAAGSRPGGFSAAGGLATKARLLEIEGAAGVPFSAPERRRGRAPRPSGRSRSG